MNSFKRKIILSLLVVTGVSSCSKNTQESDLALNTINAEEIKTDGTVEVMELPAPLMYNRQLVTEQQRKSL